MSIRKTTVGLTSPGAEAYLHWFEDQISMAEMGQFYFSGTIPAGTNAILAQPDTVSTFKMNGAGENYFLLPAKRYMHIEFDVMHWLQGSEDDEAVGLGKHSISYTINGASAAAFNAVGASFVRDTGSLTEEVDAPVGESILPLGTSAYRLFLSFSTETVNGVDCVKCSWNPNFTPDLGAPNAGADIYVFAVLKDLVLVDEDYIVQPWFSQQYPVGPRPNV